MKITIGDSVMDIKEWASEPEMISFINSCPRSIFLGSNSQSPGQAVSIIVSSIDSKQTLRSIGISTEGTGIQAKLLIARNGSFCAIGFNNEVVGFDSTLWDCQFKLRMIAPFVDFVQVGEDIVVLNEGGVQRLTRNGKIKWAYDSDLIEDWSIEKGSLDLRFMDDPAILLDLESGTAQTK